jgi:hypothetical protein
VAAQADARMVKQARVLVAEVAFARARLHGGAARLSHRRLSSNRFGKRRSADHGGGMKKLSDSSSTTLVTRTLDAVDRGHARAAARLHEVRNELLATLERSIDRAEKVSAIVINRARKSIKRADELSANAVNRAQGAVGQAIETARLSRSTPSQFAS